MNFNWSPDTKKSSAKQNNKPDYKDAGSFHFIDLYSMGKIKPSEIKFTYFIIIISKNIDFSRKDLLFFSV